MLYPWLCYSDMFYNRLLCPGTGQSWSVEHGHGQTDLQLAPLQSQIGDRILLAALLQGGEFLGDQLSSCPTKLWKPVLSYTTTSPTQMRWTSQRAATSHHALQTLTSVQPGEWWSMVANDSNLVESVASMQMSSAHSTRAAIAVCNDMMAFFQSPHGSAPWQHDTVCRGTLGQWLSSDLDLF